MSELPKDVSHNTIGRSAMLAYFVCGSTKESHYPVHCEEDPDGLQNIG